MSSERLRLTSEIGNLTLVEWVVVVVILGIFAAFAVPRFARVETQTSSAVTEALASALRSSSTLAHALWLAEGQTESISMQGQVIVIANGYPNIATVAATLAIPEGFVFEASDSAGMFAKTHDGEIAITDCAVSYAPPLHAEAAPTITVNTSGC